MSNAPANRLPAGRLRRTAGLLLSAACMAVVYMTSGCASAERNQAGGPVAETEEPAFSAGTVSFTAGEPPAASGSFPVPSAANVARRENVLPAGESASPAGGRKLLNKHVTEAVLNRAVVYASIYDTENFSGLTAGVVPHHLTAAPLIGGFFRAASENAGKSAGGNAGAPFDTVILLGPNHSPRLRGGDEVTVSSKGWAADGGERGTACDTEIIEAITEIKLTDGVIVGDDTRMEDDHAVSSLVPFVRRYWPEAKVAPVLVGRSLTYGDTLRLADGLTEIISGADKRVLLLCSVDFSHYLSPEEARERDAKTRTEMERAGYGTIYAFTDANADSPASLIIFLRYTENTGGAVEVVDNTDASAFTSVGAEGTTSYFVLTGGQRR